MEGIYQDYYRLSAKGQGAESLLDRTIATRSEYFSKVYDYIVVRSLLGLSKEQVKLPESIEPAKLEASTDAVTQSLARLYAPLRTAEPSIETSTSGAGRAEGVHRFVIDTAPSLPDDVTELLNVDLPEEVKAAVIEGNGNYVADLLAAVKEHRQEPFLKEGQNS